MAKKDRWTGLRISYDYEGGNGGRAPATLASLRWFDSTLIPYLGTLGESSNGHLHAPNLFPDGYIPTLNIQRVVRDLTQALNESMLHSAKLEGRIAALHAILYPK